MWLAFQVDLGRVRLNRLKLEQGEFTYSPEDAALKHTKAIVDIFVDGVNFIDEMRERIGHDAISPLYPDILCDNLKKKSKHREEVFVGGCTCGCPDCEPLFVDIDIEKDTVVWSNCSYIEYENGEPHTKLAEMEPLVFDREEYFAEVAKMEKLAEASGKAGQDMSSQN